MSSSSSSSLRLSLLIATGVFFVQSFSLGNPLVFGPFVQDLLPLMNGTDEGQIAFIGTMEYVIFLFCGVIVYWIELCYQYFHVQKLKQLPGNHIDRARRRSQALTSLIGFCSWILGYLLSIFLTHNFVAFTGILVSFGGLGSGLLYWNMLNVILSCVHVHVPFIIGAVFLAPAIYVMVIPPAIEAARQVDADSWARVTTYIVAIGGATILFFIILIHAIWVPKYDSVRAKVISGSSTSQLSKTPSMLISSNDIRGSTNSSLPVFVKPNPNKHWAKHNRFSLALYCLSLLCFQASFFVPYIRVAPFATSLGMTSTGTISTVMLGAGSIVGRIVFPAFAFFNKKESFQTYMQILVVVGMTVFLGFWDTMIDAESMEIFAFFFGFFSGGGLVFFLSLHKMLWVGVNGLTLAFCTACLAFSMTIGETISAVVFYTSFGSVQDYYWLWSWTFSCASTVMLVFTHVVFPYCCAERREQVIQQHHQQQEPTTTTVTHASSCKMAEV